MNQPERYLSELSLGSGLLFQEKVDSLTRGGAKTVFQYLKNALRTSERQGDKNNIGWSLLNIAMVLRGQRQYEAAIQVLEKARTIFSSIRNDFGLASTLEELSYANRELDRNALALEYSHKAIDMFQTLNRPLELAWAYDNMSVIYFNLYRRNESLTYGKKARLIFMEFNYQSCLAWNACNLGGLYFEMGFHSRAERYYEEAHKTFQQLKSKQGMAWSLLSLGIVNRAECAWARAEDYFERARALFEELELKDRMGWCMLNIAAIRRVQGLDEDAIAINKKAIQLFGPLKNHDGVAWGLFQVGQILRDRGQLVKAWQTTRKALNLHTDIAHQKGMGWAENELGQIYMGLTDQSHARDCFVRAKVKAEQLDSVPLKAEVDKNLAHFYFDEGLLHKGVELLTRSEETCRKHHLWEVCCEVLMAQGRHAIICGDLTRARDRVEAAAEMAEQYGLARVKPSLLLAQAEIRAGQGDGAGAVAGFTEAAAAAQRLRQRRVRAEALIGLIQLQRTEKNSNQIISSLDLIEKDVRAIGSRKLKARFLAVKGWVHYAITGFVDNRFFSQTLQILGETELVIVKYQLLMLLAHLYEREGKEREAKDAREQLARLADRLPVDLQHVSGREKLFTVLPISIVS